MPRSTRIGAIPTAPPPPPEAAIQVAIIGYLHLCGWYVIRQNSGALPNPQGRPVRFGTPGLPDLLALKDGRYLWIEVKRPGQKPRPTQLKVHAELRQQGAVVIVATCVDDVLAALWDMEQPCAS